MGFEPASENKIIITNNNNYHGISISNHITTLRANSVGLHGIERELTVRALTLTHSNKSWVNTSISRHVYYA